MDTTHHLTDGDVGPDSSSSDVGKTEEGNYCWPSYYYSKRMTPSLRFLHHVDLVAYSRRRWEMKKRRV